MQTALVVIDVQSDFCPGGALAVADGDSIVPLINAKMNDYDIIALTQDWHPAGHSSFASSQEGNLRLKRSRCRMEPKFFGQTIAYKVRRAQLFIPT